MLNEFQKSQANGSIRLAMSSFGRDFWTNEAFSLIRGCIYCGDDVYKKLYSLGFDELTILFEQLANEGNIDTDAAALINRHLSLSDKSRQSVIATVRSISLIEWRK